MFYNFCLLKVFFKKKNVIYKHISCENLHVLEDIDRTNCKLWSHQNINSYIFRDFYFMKHQHFFLKKQCGGQSCT